MHALVHSLKNLPSTPPSFLRIVRERWFEQAREQRGRAGCLGTFCLLSSMESSRDQSSWPSFSLTPFSLLPFSSHPSHSISGPLCWTLCLVMLSLQDIWGDWGCLLPVLGNTDLHGYQQVCKEGLSPCIMEGFIPWSFFYFTLQNCVHFGMRWLSLIALLWKQ